MSKRLLLLHGIWMGPWAMFLLKRRLAEAGWLAESMAYSSIFHGPGGSVEAIRTRLQGAQQISAIVAHSLGGLMALEALQQLPAERRSALICLGTPIQGSAVARRLKRGGIGTLGMGRSCEMLCSGWSGEQLPGSVAMIAGSRGVGMGRVLGGLQAPHDGTVAVSETCHPGLRAHHCVEVTHSGLLLSRTVAERVDKLLHTLLCEPGVGDEGRVT